MEDFVFSDIFPDLISIVLLKWERETNFLYDNRTAGMCKIIYIVFEFESSTSGTVFSSSHSALQQTDEQVCDLNFLRCWIWVKYILYREKQVHNSIFHAWVMTSNGYKHEESEIEIVVYL